MSMCFEATVACLFLYLMIANRAYKKFRNLFTLLAGVWWCTYLYSMQRQAIYDMCHQTLSFLRDFTSNTLCFSCSPLINWPPCASGHLETKPFLRDPNHAQKRAKCMYRIKGSNPVLVMLQKRHLTEDTKHVLGVSATLWMRILPVQFGCNYREFSGPGCGVQIRQSSRRRFLRCRGMYKVSIALYPDVFIKQGCSTFESHNWNQDVSCS